MLPNNLLKISFKKNKKMGIHILIILNYHFIHHRNKTSF
jgi:hypothetical protein